MNLDPIAIRYRLTCTPDQAFDTYVRLMPQWWHPQYTANAETFTGATIEPQVGGQVVERHRTGEQYVWGEVTVYEPPHRLSYTSTLAQPPDHQSMITVSFQPDRTGGTAMLFEHGGWTAQNAADRDKFTEWTVILDRYAALADS